MRSPPEGYELPGAAAAGYRYDTTTIVFHWITALSVAVLWGLASESIPFLGSNVIDLFPNGQPRIVARSIHITLGVTLLCILGARLFWRSWNTGASPKDAGFLAVVARIGHYLIYALLASTLILGLGFEWVRGDVIFGLFKILAFDPGNRELRGYVGFLHDWSANALLIVAGFHAMAALFHHYVLRDDVLRRMLPMSRRKNFSQDYK